MLGAQHRTADSDAEGREEAAGGGKPAVARYRATVRRGEGDAGGGVDKRGWGESPVSQARAEQRRSRRSARWVPDQHGAWAMLLLPFAAAVWLAGPAWVHVPLLALWITGYLAYAAASTWLRARRRRRLLPPVLVLGGATAAFAVPTVVLAPFLVRWLVAYVPLLLASLWLASRGRERSATNDALAVAAAVLMAAVAFDAGRGADWAALWTVAGMLLFYFLGTVLYVKTMIRERGRRGYVVASVGYHLAGVLVAVVFVTADAHTAWLPVVAAVLALRAAAGPAVNARRSRPLRPAVVGVGEIIAALVVTAVALVGVVGSS